jgi:NAD(P)-dependent dehydrogenase (short-subunit alcohol dehydrogenase family)
VSKYCAEQMSKQEPEDGERGVIVNVASIAGIEGQRGQVLYGGTKGAILGMTLPMARDLARFQIRVVTLAPGFFILQNYYSLFICLGGKGLWILDPLRHPWEIHSVELFWLIF